MKVQMCAPGRVHLNPLFNYFTYYQINNLKYKHNTNSKCKTLNFSTVAGRCLFYVLTKDKSVLPGGKK